MIKKRFSSQTLIQAILLAQGPLTFCAMRCALDERKLHAANEDMALELPAPVSRKLYEIIAVNAMQFGGYIFKVNEGQARTPISSPAFLLPSSSSVRMCLFVQSHLTPS